MRKPGSVPPTLLAPEGLSAFKFVFWVLGSGFGVLGFGFKVWIRALGFRDFGVLGFRVWGLGFRVPSASDGRAVCLAFNTDRRGALALALCE